MQSYCNAMKSIMCAALDHSLNDDVDDDDDDDADDDDL